MKGTIILPIKKKWFDMIKSGEKKEEHQGIAERENKKEGIKHGKRH